MGGGFASNQRVEPQQMPESMPVSTLRQIRPRPAGTPPSFIAPRIQPQVHLRAGMNSYALGSISSPRTAAAPPTVPPPSQVPGAAVNVEVVAPDVPAPVEASPAELETTSTSAPKKVRLCQSCGEPKKNHPRTCYKKK